MEDKPILKTLKGKIIIGVSITAILASTVFFIKYIEAVNNKNKLSNEYQDDIDDTQEEIGNEEENESEVTEDDDPSEDYNEGEEIDIENEEDAASEEVSEEYESEVEVDTSRFAVKYVYRANSLNVRSGPDVAYEKLGSLAKGKEVKVYQEEGDWSIIEFKGGLGYVASEYLTDKVADTKPTAKPNTGKYNNVIWSFSTKYQTGIPRATNVELASSRINNTVIAPGEQVSYTELIGDVTIENGYVSAPIMVNGVANQSGVGGGVCQVSTTLYVAALKSGLTDIVSRNHSGRVSYVPAGWDAVISGSQDLKIRNTYDENIMISSYCKGGNLVVEFKSENPLLNGKTYDLRTSSSNKGLTVKLNVVEKYNGGETVVYTRTSNYVK